MNIVIDGESVSYGLQAKSGPLPGFINIILLEHRTLICLHIFYDYFCTTAAELNRCDEIWPAKPAYILYDTLQKKFADSWNRQTADSNVCGQEATARHRALHKGAEMCVLSSGSSSPVDETAKETTNHGTV